jgi:hypothetical protein
MVRKWENLKLRYRYWKIWTIYSMQVDGPGSSVGTATELRAGWSGIESRWGRDFPSAQTGPGAHPASCKMGTGSFAGVKYGGGVLLTTHPLLVPRSWKSRAIPLYPPSGSHRACNDNTLPFTACKEKNDYLTTTEIPTCTKVSPSIFPTILRNYKLSSLKNFGDFNYYYYYYYYYYITKKLILSGRLLYV